MKKNDEQKKEIMRLYTEEKLSSTEIAKKLGLKRHIVISRLRFAGVTMRTQKESIIVRDIRTNIPRNEMVSMYVDKKMSMRQIGDEVGLTIGAVQSILRSRKVKFRSVKEGYNLRFPEGRFGEQSANWKGGRRVANNQGYIYIYTPDHPNATKDGYVLEHRLVLEEVLGRFLEPQEIAHHINGDKTDNRPENIGLLATHGAHVSEHFKAIKEVARLKKILDDNNLPF